MRTTKVISIVDLRNSYEKQMNLQRCAFLISTRYMYMHAFQSYGGVNMLAIKSLQSKGSIY